MAKDLIAEVNVVELLKVAEASEKQYDAVVKQNKDLQAEVRRCRTCLEKVLEELAYLDDNCSIELTELKSAYSKMFKIIHEVL